MILKSTRVRGLFVSFEGLDGSGKSTLVDEVYQFLKRQNYPVESVAEFSESSFGEYLRDTLTIDKFMRSQTKGKSFLTQVFAIYLDWIYLTEQIILPHLNSGKIVLKDRHIDSVIACQLPNLLAEYSLDKEEAFSWFKHVISIAPVIPDLTVYLDVPLEERINRLGSRDSIYREAQGHTVSQEDIRVFSAQQTIFEQIAKEAPDRVMVYSNYRKELTMVTREIAELILSRWKS